MPRGPRLTDGSLSLEEDMGRIEELQELLEKQNFELSQARERLVTLTAAVTELEEDLGTARRDLIKSEELSSKQQRDLREVSKVLQPLLSVPSSCWVQVLRTQEGVAEVRARMRSVRLKTQWVQCEKCWMIGPWPDTKKGV